MSETNIDLNGLLLLSEIHLQGGYRQAADRLGLSPATASRRIADLEDKLGVKLLERNARYVGLTNAGERLLQGTTGQLEQVRLAIEDVKERANAVAGLVRIATTTTLAETLVVPIMGRLRSTYPDVRIEILVDEEVVDIRQQRIDFAIRGGDLGDFSAIARKLCRHRFSCWTIPELIEQSDVPLLSYHVSRLGDASQASVVVRDMGIIKQLVLNGLGEAWLPDSYCTQEQAGGTLVRREDREEYWYDIYVLYPSRAGLTQRAKVVIDALFESEERHLE